MVHAGCWVRLNGYENGVQPSIDSGLIGVCPAGLASKAGDGHGRRHEQVEAGHPLAHHRPELPAAKHQALHVEVAQARPELCLRREVRIGAGLLVGPERVPDRPRAAEPQPGGDLERVGEAGVHRIDERTGVGELGRCRGDGGGHLRMDVLGVAERG
jgi:hypothetical protein